MTTSKKNLRAAVWTGHILLIPLVLTLLAIWNWKPGAFVMMAVLLLGAAGVTYEMVSKKWINNKFYLLAVVVALAAVGILAFMNVAVGGILGDNPANMMYFGVLLVGLIGSAIARLQPAEMFAALLATALAIILVPAVALYIGTPAFQNGVGAVFGLHAIFATLFTASAFLFRKAAAEVK